MRKHTPPTIIEHVAPFKVGEKIRRLRDGRTFKVTFINPDGINCGVFSAKPTDKQWSWWGGPFPSADEFEVLERLAAVSS